MAPQSDITLYTDATPNGIKITIALEELGLPYKTEHLDISTNKQKEPWFLAINPNGRIPAMTDKLEDGSPINLFEGGSILQYLAERYDTEHKISFPRGSREHFEMANWVYWQHGGLGPMQGQANHFFRYAPEKIQYGIDRYINESRRLYKCLDTQLASSKSGFIVGDHLSLADLACYGWVYWAGWAGVDIEEFQNVKAWEGRMTARPAINKGKDIPKKLNVKEKLADPKFADEYAKKAREWIMKGMGDDKQKQ